MLNEESALARAIRLSEECMHIENEYHSVEERKRCDQQYREWEPKWRAMVKLYENALQSLLNKVNRVTANQRHGLEVTEESLTELSNRQIEVETIQKHIYELAKEGLGGSAAQLERE